MSLSPFPFLPPALLSGLSVSYTVACSLCVSLCLPLPEAEKEWFLCLAHACTWEARTPSKSWCRLCGDSQVTALTTHYSIIVWEGRRGQGYSIPGNRPILRYSDRQYLYFISEWHCLLASLPLPGPIATSMAFYLHSKYFWPLVHLPWHLSKLQLVQLLPTHTCSSQALWRKAQAIQSFPILT